MKTYRDLFERSIGQKTMEPGVDTPEKQRLREPGDVGKVERLQQMGRKKSRNTRIPADAKLAELDPELRSKGDEVLKGLGVTGAKGAGTYRVPRDYKDPYQYQRNVDQQARKTGVSDEETPNIIDVQKKTNFTDTDDKFDQAIRSAEAPTLNRPLKIGRGEVADSPALTHGYQRSGVGILNKTAYDSDVESNIISAITDPDLAARTPESDKFRKPDGEVKNNLEPKVVGRDDLESEIKDPTARDLENVTQRGEDQAVKDGKAYLTPEVVERQKAMRDAMNGQNSKKVQELSFKFPDISDEQLDSFIDNWGQSRGQLGAEGKKKLVAELEGRGGTDGERGIIYSGNTAGIPDEARFDDNGKKLPDDMVNMNKISDSDLKKEIKGTRGKELIRTYLKQGGVNAYAPHEGLRSPGDMDLEHIKSLKAGGMDHPSNWVWASRNLNQLRGDQDLEPIADTRIDKQGVTGPEDGRKLGQTTQFVQKDNEDFKSVGQVKKTFQQFFRGDKEKQDAFTKEFGQPGTKNKNFGIFSPDEYKNLSPEEIQDNREIAQNKYGMSPEMAAGFFPDAGDLKGTPYGEDPKQYDADSTRNLRDQLVYRQALAKAGKLGLSKDEIQKIIRQKGAARAMEELPQKPENITDL